ncbi:alpha-1,3-mannosyl-glycoprotein 2-beta-N-acetylglucosaminyltransferase-like isoform X1 [Pecten maximus]|uniref:alpha-1,3-mannosyl-glycoprotein 2-beta-N-acetylglucosaminyltransferase-like isoform X1 n=1 Tax=Pecten maximus TaxID=6579 RepID=UPI0014591733|nr:alpha-1,3-mannosyl-glycoprotein 2-beta-N-acetylglucosaminyltransferase-like isoform X1 [Pecten maximus]
MRRKHLVVVVVTIFLCWNIMMYYLLVSKNPGKSISFEEKLTWLEADIKHELKENTGLLEQLRKLRQDAERQARQKAQEAIERQADRNVAPVEGPAQHRTEAPVKVPVRTNNEPVDANSVILPILMIACDRVSVSRSLDQLLKYRTSPERFPIIVSQDCGHQATSDVIQKYVVSDNIIHIKQPDLSEIELPWPKKKFSGYYKIARHYKWALNQIFHHFNHSAVIIVEDDLDISPDFFEYFAATYPILTSDPSLWCVSAWNDNGKGGMVSDEPELLYRSDFFPGLGWMMERKLWLEIGPKWPVTFWDDWMRHQDQRKERVCIRPEICRTSTFGKKGVSLGLFYEKHLKHIKLNDKFVAFTKKDLSYLKKENYDPWFTHMVYETPEVTVAEVMSGSKKHLKALRVTYTTKEQFKSVAKRLGIMDDFKAGVPRVAYRGVTSFIYSGQRIYLAPKSDWQKYDLTWT